MQTDSTLRPEGWSKMERMPFNPNYRVYAAHNSIKKIKLIARDDPIELVGSARKFSIVEDSLGS